MVCDSVLASATNSVRARVLYSLMFGGGTAVYFVLPIWAGLFEEQFGYSSTQIGWLLSADMSANTIAILLTRFWIHRVDLRRAIIFALILFCGGNLLSISADSFKALLALRYIVGIGMGSLVAMAVVGIGATAKPDRNFGFALTAQVLIGGVLLFATPWLLRVGGIKSYFVTFSLLILFVLPLLGGMPKSLVKRSQGAVTTSSEFHPALLLAFASIALFFTAMSSFWAFVERIADQGGLSRDYVSFALSASILISASGALLAAWMSDRFGRIRPILVSIFISAGSIVLLLLDPTQVVFFVSINLFNWTYNFVIPFQSGWVADLDKTGRNITLLPAVQGAGISIGPIVAGSLISGTDYTTVIYLSTGLLLVSGIMFVGLRASISDSKAGIDQALEAPIVVGKP